MMTLIDVSKYELKVITSRDLALDRRVTKSPPSLEHREIQHTEPMFECAPIIIELDQQLIKVC